MGSVFEGLAVILLLDVLVTAGADSLERRLPPDFDVLGDDEDLDDGDDEEEEEDLFFKEDFDLETRRVRTGLSDEPLLFERDLPLKLLERVLVAEGEADEEEEAAGVLSAPVAAAAAAAFFSAAFNGSV